ncbi:RNA polymerase sigma factor [Ruminococcus flavefaciens]|jgi:RNA polymerase sigma-70 factor (ECF subfamily)|uniref:RNA polymerase sigma factor n=1 Tax=Ruminococcus flavefaciens TaxID=1265 RepID=UPI00048AE4B4|nr:RNA polymerase sigma factor [Ruminococcus flavefaciens]
MGNGESSYRRFLAGDDSGMVELVHEFRDGLMLYLQSYTHNISDAEDCVQDTFIRLAVKKPKFSGKSSFKTWLYTIGRNIAADHRRRDKRNRNVSLDDQAPIADEADLERSYLVSEQKINLRHTMQSLKEEYQQVLYLTYFEGFSNDETARIMGKSRKQTENLLYNARKALRTELEKGGFSYENI